MCDALFQYQSMEAVLPPLEDVAPTSARVVNVQGLVRRDNAAHDERAKLNALRQPKSTAEDKRVQYDTAKRQIFECKEALTEHGSPSSSGESYPTSSSTAELPVAPRKVTVLRRRDLHLDEDYRR